MGGEAVAQHMGSYSLGDTGEAGGVAADLLDGGRVNVRAGFGAGEEPVGGALQLIVSTQQDQQAVTEDGVSILGAFAVLDVDEHALGIDVSGLERDGFGDAETGAVAEHQHGAVLEDADVLEEGEDLLFTEDDGECFGDFHAAELGLGPGHFQGDGVEKLDGGEEAVDGMGDNWRFSMR